MGIVAYWLVLPPSLSGVYEVFHVSMLRKYTPDPTHVVDWEEITIDTDGTFEEAPVCILGSRDQILRRKTHTISKSVVVTQGSGGGNMGTRGHDTGHLSFPI